MGKSECLETYLLSDNFIFSGKYKKTERNGDGAQGHGPLDYATKNSALGGQDASVEFEGAPHSAPLSSG